MCWTGQLFFTLFFALFNFQVMFKVRQARATPPPPPRRTRIRRTSSRRSGYAFSHAQGYGDLVTSGRYLRRPAVSWSSGFPQVGRATTGFSPMGRSAGYSPTGRPQNSKVPDVEVTSLQMYRTISDPPLWCRQTVSGSRSDWVTERRHHCCVGFFLCWNIFIKGTAAGRITTSERSMVYCYQILR